MAIVNGRGLRSGMDSVFESLRLQGHEIITGYVVIKGNKDKDSVCEEYAEDNICDEDGSFGKAPQGPVCHRKQTSL